MRESFVRRRAVLWGSARRNACDSVKECFARVNATENIHWMKFVLQGISGSGKTPKLLHLALLSARKGCQVLIVGVASRLRSVPLQHVISTDTDEILNRIQFR
jgi:hypothetical protein